MQVTAKKIKKQYCGALKGADYGAPLVLLIEPYKAYKNI